MYDPNAVSRSGNKTPAKSTAKSALESYIQSHSEILNSPQHSTPHYSTPHYSTPHSIDAQHLLAQQGATDLALLHHYKLIEAGLNSAHDALLMLDLSGNVRFSNEAFKQLFKIELANSAVSSRAQLLSHSLQHLSGSQALERAIHQSINNPALSIECEFETYDANHLEASSRPHLLDEQLVGQIWTFHDVTQARIREEESKHRAYHDSLTGLPNRRLLSIRLNQALNTLDEELENIAVLFIDLDGFKDVNDSLGHNMGDALLKDVTYRLESILPPHSYLARHGGDEFVVVMEKINSINPAVELSQTIINSFDQSFLVSAEEIYMSVSIGVALSPEHGLEADKLISNADMAMYQAKQQGRHTYEVFTTAKDSQAYQRLKIRNQINVALEREEFELFFQPKICLEDGSIKGAEALIRWRAEDGKYRSPLEFIPIAEENGQIIPISQWVIYRCCQYLEEWMDDLDEDFVLALNISAKHFLRGQLQIDMKQVLNKIDIDPSKLEIEVTETAIMDNLELAVDSLQQLKKLGIRTAIDDFGTGHSSLSYLRKLPIEILKIDKSFIDEILISPEDRTLVRGIIDMVHALGIQVVAEGVENHEMAEMLLEMNCDLVQGFHYCRPISADEFIELIKSRQCYL